MFENRAVSESSSSSPNWKEEGVSAGADIWFDWLLNRRHGSDDRQAETILQRIKIIRDRVLDGAALAPGMVLVDVGAGDGLISFGAFERIGPSLRVVFTDISNHLLKYSSDRAEELGVSESCTFLCTPAQHLEGVGDNSADVVTSRAVLAHIDDKASAASQMFRVLKPGGRISLAEPINRDDAVELASLSMFLDSKPDDRNLDWQRLVRKCRALQLPSTAEEIQRNALTNFSERDLIRIFHGAGFEELHLELHIDVRRSPPTAWDAFINTAPRPGTLTLQEIFSTQLTEIEQKEVERRVRPSVENGEYQARAINAYLTAEKPLGGTDAT